MEGCYYVEHNKVLDDEYSDQYEYFGYYCQGLHKGRYRETQHRSILSLSDSYEEGCYNEMARDIDSQLALVDMEDYRAEDILNTLPSICCHELQPSRKGEMFASLSKSVQSRLRDFDSFLSPHWSSQEGDEEDEDDEDDPGCRSGPLFSPVREAAKGGGVTYSVDSLDCDQPDVMLTCELIQANKHNYTIAFEGSTVMDDSDTGTGETSNTSASGAWSSGTAHGPISVAGAGAESTGSGSGSGGEQRTTWCKVVSRRNHRNCMRHSTASLPGTGKRRRPSSATRLDRSTGETGTDRLGGRVKLYDVQHSSGSGYGCEMSQSRLSLLRLFIKQRSLGCAMTHSECATTDHATCDNRLNKTAASCERNNRNETWVDQHQQQQQSEFADSLMDESESVERLSESVSVSVCSCDHTASLTADNSRQQTTQQQQLSNNNNSSTSTGTDDRDVTRSPVSQMRRGTQTRTSSTSSSVSDPTTVRSRSSATQCPVHCVDATMQTSLQPQPQPQPQPQRTTQDDTAAKPIGGSDVGGGGGVKRPVYIMYPNYTLPDLSFLRGDKLSMDLEQVVLTPVKFSPCPTPSPTGAQPAHAPPHPLRHVRRTRPHSCADIQHLRKKGFSHIRDWESLATLLPPEYCTLLADIPELQEYRHLCGKTPKPLFCTTPPPEAATTVNCSSSSNSTQPSSGYRGSSTALTDSSANPSPAPQGQGRNPMFVYRYDSTTTSESGCSGPPLPKRSISLPEDKNAPSEAPPRPPLPRGILRNSLENAKMHKNQANRKRHSMFDMETTNVDDPELAELERNMKAKAAAAVAAGGLSGSDEGIGGEWRPPTPPTTHTLRLQQLLESSGDHWDPSEMDALRQQVSKFLCQGNRKSVSFADKNGGVGVGVEGGEELESMTPPNSPQVSVTHRPPPVSAYQMKNGPSLNETTIAEDLETSFTPDKTKLAVKTDLVEAVCRAANRLAQQQADQSNQSAGAPLALGQLCPALYALLGDGLRPTLDTPFGEINNSVWQVVEASSQQGQMTKALNELVVKLNGEDVLTEGVVKFNAFIFGLLNVQGLDVWLSYLRTRESVLRRHYAAQSLLLCACRGEATARALSDRLIAALRPLSRLPFRLDLLYETRLLHQSLMQLSKLASSPSHSVSSGGSWSLRRATASPPPPHHQQEGVRPRSCVEAAMGADVAGMVARKRWSVNLAGRLTQAYDRLDDTDDDYTDSLEGGGGPRGSGGSGGGGQEEGGDKFRRLQMKWEMLSGREGDTDSRDSTPHTSPVKSCSATPKSRIPRPVTSPQSQTAPSAIQQHTPRPPIKRQLTAPSPAQSQLRRPSVTPARGPVKARTSRADAPVKTVGGAGVGGGGPVARPSSLPYRGVTRPLDQRRAASSSTARQQSSKQSSSNRQQHQQQHRHVVTLSHRLPSDSGHLAYNEGERLRLVLDVDDTWLLCCRGDAKGLVPRSGVIMLPHRP